MDERVELEDSSFVKVLDEVEDEADCYYMVHGSSCKGDPAKLAVHLNSLLLKDFF